MAEFRAKLRLKAVTWQVLHSFVQEAVFNGHRALVKATLTRLGFDTIANVPEKDFNRVYTAIRRNVREG